MTGVISCVSAVPKSKGIISFNALFVKEQVWLKAEGLRVLQLGDKLVRYKRPSVTNNFFVNASSVCKFVTYKLTDNR